MRRRARRRFYLAGFVKKRSEKEMKSERQGHKNIQRKMGGEDRDRKKECDQQLFDFV